jgi:hypothetical protein
MTFYGLVAAVIFLAMTALWVFGEEEPTGAVFVISTVLWWGSALMLVFFGLTAISRFRREPAAHRGAAARRGTERSEG